MVVTAERFAQGMTYDQFKESMTRNRERLEANEREVPIDQKAIDTFKNLPEPLNVLVIAEDWCGDVIANLPILGQLAEKSGKLNLRVFQRDQNLDLIDQYLKQGLYRAIPVFVFFDQHWHEVGRFIERPDSVTELRAQKRREIYAANPAFGSPDAPPDQLPEEVRVQLTQALAQSREETKPQADADVVKALREIVAGVAA